MAPTGDYRLITRFSSSNPERLTIEAHQQAWPCTDWTHGTQQTARPGVPSLR
jgi:hypothetical protein